VTASAPSHVPAAPSAAVLQSAPKPHSSTLNYERPAAAQPLAAVEQGGAPPAEHVCVLAAAAQTAHTVCQGVGHQSNGTHSLFHDFEAVLKRPSGAPHGRARPRAWPQRSYQRPRPSQPKGEAGVPLSIRISWNARLRELLL
jgi:hypothetical protein